MATRFSLPSSATRSEQHLVGSSTDAAVILKFSPKLKLCDASFPILHKHLQYPRFALSNNKCRNSPFPVALASFHTASFLNSIILNLATLVRNGGSELKQSLAGIRKGVKQKADECRFWLGNALTGVTVVNPRVAPCFASVSGGGKEVFQVALHPEQVLVSFQEVPVYAVCNPYNEFMLISDPENDKSLCMLSFRAEDAQTFLEQAKRSVRGLQRGSSVVPLTFRQVYQLKAQGIAFRFLPDPIQVRNAIEIQRSESFLGVPVFQSDVIILEKERQRLIPMYFRKEDLVEDLEKILRKKSKVAQAVSAMMVGSLEDVLKQMEEKLLPNMFEVCMDDEDRYWSPLRCSPAVMCYF
eukprot:TRINITY_DN1773_c0_g1_i3.p1 TRINITY_DN1773_c0_g1~~TRINITY_DN1773_c0_g1_i3.p1  ORF type:complete len:354 (+),score=43.72 TRINITY_DN1773_c0_g1_i3:176-1237(+)